MKLLLSLILFVFIIDFVIKLIMFTPGNSLAWRLVKSVFGRILGLLKSLINKGKQEIIEIKQSENPKTELAVKAKGLFRKLGKALVALVLAFVLFVQTLNVISASRIHKESNGEISFFAQYVEEVKHTSFIYAIYKGIKLTIEENRSSK